MLTLTQGLCIVYALFFLGFLSLCLSFYLQLLLIVVSFLLLLLLYFTLFWLLIHLDPQLSLTFLSPDSPLHPPRVGGEWVSGCLVLNLQLGKSITLSQEGFKCWTPCTVTTVRRQILPGGQMSCCVCHWLISKLENLWLWLFLSLPNSLLPTSVWYLRIIGLSFFISRIHFSRPC